MKSHALFQKIYKRGRAYHAKYMVLFCLKSDVSAVGVVASKKVGNAVVRNRCKRRLRALFQHESTLIEPFQYILVAKAGLHDAPAVALQKEFKMLLKKAHVYAGVEKTSA